jgi:hypothetical protein
LLIIQLESYKVIRLQGLNVEGKRYTAAILKHKAAQTIAAIKENPLDTRPGVHPYPNLCGQLYPKKRARLESNILRILNNPLEYSNLPNLNLEP